MINLKKVLAGVMASAMMFSAVGCSMVEKTEEGIRKTVVAKVYGEKVTLGEIDDSLGGFFVKVKEQYGENYKENAEVMQYIAQQRLSVLDTAVQDRIFAAKAKELNIMPTDEELTAKADEKLTEMKAAYESEEKFKETLTMLGVTEEELVKDVKLSTISELVYDEVTKDVKPTEEDYKKYYEENKNSYTEKTNRVRPAHIVVKDEATAKEIIEKLNGGADFAELAAEYGTDATKDKGGDLDWVEYNSTQIDQTFLLAAKALEKGAYTPTPIHTQFGYHVIKCLDKEEYPVQAYDEVKDKVEAAVLKEQKDALWKETFTKWQEEADVKLYEEKLSE